VRVSREGKKSKGSLVMAKVKPKKVKYHGIKPRNWRHHFRLWYWSQNWFHRPLTKAMVQTLDRRWDGLGDYWFWNRTPMPAAWPSPQQYLEGMMHLFMPKTAGTRKFWFWWDSKFNAASMRLLYDMRKKTA